MAKYKIWQIEQNIPQKLAESDVGLEKNLEDWIEADPSLLPGELKIISRQMPVEGGRLDLLALDPSGRCIVIEIKAGKLSHNVITQALYYAAQVDQYSFEDLASKVHDYPAAKKKNLRAMFLESGVEPGEFGENSEVMIYLVGTHRSPGLETMLDFMASKYHVPITVVTFEVFQLANGQRVLLREISEADTAKSKPQKAAATEENVCALADQTGIGQEFRFILKESKKMGLHFRPYARSIMYTHPEHKTRMLFTTWAHQKPLKAYIGHEAFMEYYEVTADQALAALGPSGYRKIDMDKATQLLSGISRLITDDTVEE